MTKAADIIKYLGGKLPTKDAKFAILNTKVDELSNRMATQNAKIEKIIAHLALMNPAGQATPAQQPTSVLVGPQSQSRQQVPVEPQFQAQQQPQQRPTYSYTPLQPLAPGPSVQTNPRTLEGRLNFDTRIKERHMTDQERRVWNAWPEIVLEADSENMGETQDKNRVVIPSHLRIEGADHLVFSKLREMQQLLQLALVPWRLWPIRVATELDKDFLPVKHWAFDTHPDWLTFVEAIIQTTQDYNVTYNSVTDFATMLPQKGETVVGFIDRIREAFYRMPANQTSTLQVRALLVDKLKTYTGAIWRDIHLRADNLTTAELLAAAAQSARFEANIKIQSGIFNSPSASAETRLPSCSKTRREGP